MIYEQRRGKRREERERVEEKQIVNENICLSL